ncbi:hypothetical protein CEXT_697081 [Caerostris extrusa]|uniref:Uncharacterized protein n=1 Tax=Caerostris extrusa TaxID=172846 RepID=A0AAV4RU03_CAEEX|nr:hypothetical protein CEXT_697081 [Caerostris extrusa]
MFCQVTGIVVELSGPHERDVTHHKPRTPPWRRFLEPEVVDRAKEKVFLGRKEFWFKVFTNSFTYHPWVG